MYGTIALKLIAGMLGVLFFLRIAGKAQMAQITPLDTVSAFVIGALVGGVVYDSGTGVLQLLFAIGVWTLFNIAIRYSLRFKFMRRLIKGDAVYIFKSGVMNVRALKRNGMEMEQLRTLLREIGIFSMFDIDDIRFETNGKMTVSISGKTEESYLFVNNGSVLEQSLAQAGKDAGWLKKELKKFRIDAPESLFCVEWTPERGFYIVFQDGKIINGRIKTDSRKADKATA
ncbi:MAG TPA: DUF421 domain-containing protein [Candidatus Tidjanibacter gallistercoris]|nr:DUF421 domain-containing protein [Candidatus Tidjanibacter gallistercoris]